MALRAILAALLVGGWPLSADAAAQGREVREIASPPPVSVEAPPDPSLPSRLDCERAVRDIAAAYGPDDLEPWLHERFPDRAALLDALARLDLRVARLELRIEHVEEIVVHPPERSDGRLVSDCVATVRTRLVYDDPTTGERRLEEPRRARWRIRFPLSEDEAGKEPR